MNKLKEIAKILEMNSSDLEAYSSKALTLLLFEKLQRDGYLIDFADAGGGFCFYKDD